MAKIPFTLEAWLKDKSQRVETREGRIVHDIWEVKNAVTAKEYRTEVCALIEGEEDALVFFKNGKYLPVNAESPYDLFIVTPEPELTEFETALLGIINDAFDCSGYNNENAKIDAAKLLDLARKELKKTFVLLHKDDYQTAFDLGKAEALKDLPRWRKIKALDLLPCPAYLYNLAYERENNFCGRTTIHGLLIPNEAVRVGCDTWYLPVDDIQNLPKEDEK